MAVKKASSKKAAKRAATPKQESVEVSEPKAPVRKKKAARKKAAKRVAEVVTETEITEVKTGTLPPPPAEAPEQSNLVPLVKIVDSPHSEAEEGEPRRVLITVSEALYLRLAEIAGAENKEFDGDEALSVAQQAAVFVECGVALWETEWQPSAAHSVGDDLLNEDSEFAEAFQAQCTGVTKRGNVHV